jgi:hypothetical protein
MTGHPSPQPDSLQITSSKHILYDSPIQFLNSYSHITFHGTLKSQELHRETVAFLMDDKNHSAKFTVLLRRMRRKHKKGTWPICRV